MTAYLTALPNELIIEILGHVKPRDIVSFTTSCKKLKLLGARQRREHQELRSTFQRVLVVKQPSLHISQITNIFYQILIGLDKVVISGVNLPHSLHLSTLFAALPSVASLEAKGIVQEAVSRDEVDFPLMSGSTNIRNLNLESCNVPDPILFSLIRSSRSLQSLAYSQLGNGHGNNRNGTSSAFVWVHAGLIGQGSTSLKELTLRCSSSMPNTRAPFNLQCCRSLRVLNIDFALLMGNKRYATNEVATFLPASVHILNLYGCIVESLEWLVELVKSLAKSKERELPCLKELNFKETLFKRFYSASHTGEVCEVARRAGIEITITEGDAHP